MEGPGNTIMIAPEAQDHLSGPHALPEACLSPIDEEITAISAGAKMCVQLQEIAIPPNLHATLRGTPTLTRKREQE